MPPARSRWSPSWACTASSRSPGRHSRIARIIDHPPRVLVTQGKIQDRELARAGLTAADLYALLRQQGVDDLSQVGYLLYETRGVTTVIGYGADARAIADLTGAFVNPEPVYLQSTGFVLDPAGKVVVSVYSSGAIGRLVPDDVAGLVRYVRGHAATSA